MDDTSESEDEDAAYARLVSRMEANVAREKEHLAASRRGELIDDGAALPQPKSSNTPTST